jgi:hypothetical protein
MPRCSAQVHRPELTDRRRVADDRGTPRGSRRGSAQTSLKSEIAISFFNETVQQTVSISFFQM